MLKRVITEVLDNKIKMANDFACKIVGIGSIKLRTHDGRFCTLNKVRHVPSMTKNLISVSLLDSRGFKYSGGDGVLNVYRGSDVILKGFMNGTLNLLKGTTITGSANVASPEIPEKDMTKLWHMRLGHMGERGMQHLSKQDMLHSDIGLELCSEEFKQFCKDATSAKHLTDRGTPQRDGVTKWINQIMLQRAMCMLSSVGLEKRFWAEAVNTACYLINFGSHTDIECKIPSEVWSSRSAKYSLLRVFMGYGDGVKRYTVWSPSENRMVLSRNGVFDEASMVRSSGSSSEAEKGSTDKQVELQDDHEVIDVQAHTENQEERVEDVQLESTKVQPLDVTERSIVKDRPRRIDVRPPERYHFDDMVGYALQVAEEVDVSSTYMKAVSGPESEKRHVATRDMESHQKNHTWDLVTLPSGRRDVTYKWVFKIKVEASSAERVKYKARIVARGFSQREGVDYNEMFSLVVRNTFIRVLLALVARQDLELKQFDVKTVFFSWRARGDIHDSARWLSSS